MNRFFCLLTVWISYSIDDTFEIISLIPKLVDSFLQLYFIVVQWPSLFIVLGIGPSTFFTVVSYPNFFAENTWSKIRKSDFDKNSYQMAILNFPIASRKYSRWAIRLKSPSKRIVPAVSVRAMKKFWTISVAWHFSNPGRDLGGIRTN